MPHRLKWGFKERVDRLLSHDAWGEDALPALTLSQSTLLMNALSDMYAIGVMYGEGSLLQRCRQMFGDPAPLIGSLKAT